MDTDILLEYEVSTFPKPWKSLVLKHTAYSNANMPRAFLIEQNSCNSEEIQSSFTFRTADIELLQLCC